MSGIKDQGTLEELRKRLYERGAVPPARGNHELTNTETKVHTSWVKPPTPIAIPVPVTPQEEEIVTETNEPMAPRKRKYGYRLKILLGGFAVFILAIIISSGFLLFGGNSISAENITITATGPFTIGGGEVLQLQIGISNGNAVSIDSATLIVDYPEGTQSSTESGKKLFTERLSLESIKSGETINVPVRALVYGEENQEKVVEVAIEYRIVGSNATFYKEAEPLRFKISSSPLIVRADTLKKISSGQETSVTLTVTSNSPTPLSQVLVKAEYPVGFDFTQSRPSPTHAQNVWLIENLKPEETKEITITGVVIGKETDEYAINFSVGVPNERDPQTLVSVFAKAQTQFEIEQPFLDINLVVNSSGANEVVIQPDERARVQIKLTNTLEDPLNDIIVEVNLSGNAFSIYEVGPSTGYFDPTRNTITWDVSNTPSLRQANPGEVKQLTFSLQASSQVTRAPQVNVTVNAKARRVSERQVAEQLVGTASTVLKVVGSPQVFAQASHSNDIFNDTGAIPPVVGEPTTYTIALLVKNGSNETTDSIVTASLPAYVTWLDQTAGIGKISYNPTTRVLEWAAGDVDANAEVFAAFQVSLLPQSLQVGTAPVLLTEQRIRAVDNFTGTVVRDTNPPITTVLPGSSKKEGEVRATAND